MTISPGDLEAHLGQELEVLCKISGTGLAATRKRRQEPGRPPALPGDSGPEGRWEVSTTTLFSVTLYKKKQKPAIYMCVFRLFRG